MAKGRYDVSVVLSALRGAGCGEDVCGSVLRQLSLSEILLPAWCDESKDGCGGCVKAGGLYLRCGKKLVEGSNWCKTCYKNLESSEMPKHGVFSERISVENWRPPCKVAPITWMDYLVKQGVSREEGESLLNGKKIPDSEWEITPKGRRSKFSSSVSDTSSEGEKMSSTTRILPSKAYQGRAPNKKEDAICGKNGAMLRVIVFSNGTVGKKVLRNWTQEGHERFAELYGGEVGAEQGYEEPSKKSRKSKKKKSENDEGREALEAQIAELAANKEKEMAEMAAKLAEAEAKLAAAQNHESKDEDIEKKNQKSKKMKKVKGSKIKKQAVVAETHPVIDTPTTADIEANIKAKMEAEKAKMEAEMKAKMEAQMAEMKAKMEADMKAQMEAEKAKIVDDEEEVADLNDELDEEFDSDDDDSDDEEEIELNPYEHDGVTYHRSEDDCLYTITEPHTLFGHIDEDGNVVEA